jgi:hypothetical protein
MNYKPSDFFVGITDFFAILLPGALLSFLAQRYALNNIFNGVVLPQLHGPTQHWIAFAFASYVLGHIVSTLGSPLDELSNHILNPIFHHLKRQKSESARAWWGRIRKKPQGNILLEDCAKSIAKHHIDTFPDVRSNVTTAYVRLKDSAAAAEIDRMKAISKFFRSFTIVLLIFMLRCLLRGEWFISFICFSMGLFSIGLYAYQRWKRKEAIYSYFIALNIDELPTKPGA